MTSQMTVPDLSPRGQIAIDQHEGGLTFANMGEVVEFAKLMAKSQVAVPKHLRDNPGACLAVTMQAVEWRMSPFAVANKSYSVNDRLAYESQLMQAVILQRAPIIGRIRFTYDGQGTSRTCTATAVLRDGTGEVSYTSPMIGAIKVKNSPLWSQDPDQQLSYYAGRNLARRYFPDVLLGIYAEDELREDERPAQRINPLHDDVEGEATDVSPAVEVALPAGEAAEGVPGVAPSADPSESA